MATNDLTVRVDATTAQFDRAMGAAEKATQRYGAQLRLAQKAQAEFDAAVAASGASSEEAAIAQQKLGAALARTTEAEIRAGIAAKEAGEIQARSSAQAAAAAEKASLAQKKQSAQAAAAAEKASLAQKKQTESMISSLTGFSASTTGVLALGAAFVYAAKSAADFDAKMATLKALDPSANINALADAASNYADIGVSASDAADAEIELTKAGVDAADITGGALTGALNLAAAGQFDVADATTIAVQAMTQFQLAGKDVPHIADLLAAGADRALGKAQDLGEGLQYAGLTAHQLGLTVDETVGVLAEFAQAGLTGSQGGAAFQQMLLRLENPTAKSTALMQDLGLSLYDAQGNFVGVSDLAGQLQEKLGDLSQKQRLSTLATLFGSRAVRAANILYQDGADGVDTWAKKVNEAGFAAKQTHGKMDSLVGDLQKLQASLENLATSKGQGAQSPLRSLTQDATDAVPALGGLSDAFGKLYSKGDDLTGGIFPLFHPLGILGPLSDKLGGSDIEKQIDAVSSDTRLLQAAIRRQREIGAGGAFQPGAMDDLGNSFGVKAAQVTGLSHQLGSSVDDLGNSFGQVAPEAKAAGDGVAGFGADAGSAAGAADRLGFSIKDLTTALKNDQDALNHRAALRDYADAMKEVDAQQKKAHTSSQKMNESLDSQAQAALNVAATMKKGAGQVAYINRARDALYQQARQFGMTRDEADKYVNSVLHIPGQANTHVNLYAQEAQARIDHLLASYNALRDKSFTITEQIRTVGGFTPGGHTVYGNADGGLIRGPGGPTGDKILRRLSDMEFVQRASAVQREGVGAMQALNDGRATIVPLKGFANGGFAGSRPPSWGAQKVVVQQVPFAGPVTLIVGDQEIRGMIRSGARDVVLGYQDQSARLVKGTA